MVILTGKTSAFTVLPRNPWDYSYPSLYPCISLHLDTLQATRGEVIPYGTLQRHWAARARLSRTDDVTLSKKAEKCFAKEATKTSQKEIPAETLELEEEDTRPYSARGDDLVSKMNFK
jgi:hypothetical protein